MGEPATDHRRAVAERNVEAILDAAERLLESGGPFSIAAVAKEAGVSRVTVYAHFAALEELVEAVAERAVSGAMAALDAAALDDGPALDALDRLITTSWLELDRHSAVARASGAYLGAEAMRRSHDALIERVRDLVERGRAEGAFTRDQPVEWLVTASFALIHAAADDVRAGRVGHDEARVALASTLHRIFT